MAVGEDRDGVVDDLQDRVGGGAYRGAVPLADHHGELAPDLPGRGQVQGDRLASRDARFGRASSEHVDGVEFGASGSASVCGGFGQEQQIVTEEFLRDAGEGAGVI
ncbi:MAG: hypothetical protein ACRDQF_02355, partial [Thermocrispum sp.]